jgi:hypothetical protein
MLGPIVCESRALPGTLPPPRLDDDHDSQAGSLGSRSVTPQIDLIRQLNHGRSSTPAETKLKKHSSKWKVTSKAFVDSDADLSLDDEMDISRAMGAPTAAYECMRANNIAQNKAFFEEFAKDFNELGDSSKGKKGNGRKAATSCPSGHM